jgi:hypothetical protein
MFFKTFQGDVGLENFIVQSMEDPDPNSHLVAFESTVLIVLAEILDGTRTLDEIFEFHITTDMPSSWMDQKVQLVAVLDWDGDVPQVCVSGLYCGGSPILGYRANSVKDVKEWCKGSGIPFLFPGVLMESSLWAMVKIGSEYSWLSLQNNEMKIALVEYHPSIRADSVMATGGHAGDRVSWPSVLCDKLPLLTYGTAPLSNQHTMTEHVEWMHIGATTLHVINVIVSFTVILDQDIDMASPHIQSKVLASLKMPHQLFPAKKKLADALTALGEKVSGGAGIGIV